MIDYAIAIMGTTPGTKKEQITETKAYGTAQVREVLDIDKFVKHVSEHNCPFSPGTIKVSSKMRPAVSASFCWAATR